MSDIKRKLEQELLSLQIEKKRLVRMRNILVCRCKYFGTKEEIVIRMRSNRISVRMKQLRMIISRIA